MPKSTKSTTEQIADLRTQIRGAELREASARLLRERLENRLAQFELRAGTASPDAEDVHITS